MVLLKKEPDKLDRLFASLSHPYRRRILALLAEANPRTEDELTRDGPVFDAADPERAAVDVFHVHLPKVAEAGYVSWDRDAGVVERGPRFEDVAPALRLLDDHRDELPGDWS